MGQTGMAALPAAGEPAAPTQFFYEDIEALARELAKPHYRTHSVLITPEQQEAMISTARETLEAGETFFYPDNQHPLLTVSTQTGCFIIDINEKNRDCDAAKARKAIEDIKAAEKHAEIITSDNNLRIIADGYPGYRETHEVIASALVDNGFLRPERRESFIDEIRRNRLRHFATSQLGSARANVRMGSIYSNGDGTHRHEHHTQEALMDSIPYVKALRTLADTADFGQIPLDDLQIMRRIADAGDTSDDIGYTWGHALLREYVRINGRSEHFQGLCVQYRHEIETALRRHQKVTVFKDGNTVVPGTDLVASERLPREPANLAETLTIRDEKTGECLLDRWAKAGNYALITEAVSALGKATAKELPTGHRENDRVEACLTQGNASYGKTPRSIFESLGDDKLALQAVFEGLGSTGRNSVMEAVCGHVSYKYPAFVPLLAAAIKGPERQRQLDGILSSCLEELRPGWNRKIRQIADNAENMAKAETAIGLVEKEPALLAATVLRNYHLLAAIIASGRQDLFDRILEPLAAMQPGNRTLPDLSMLLGIMQRDNACNIAELVSPSFDLRAVYTRINDALVRHSNVATLGVLAESLERDAQSAIRAASYRQKVTAPADNPLQDMAALFRNSIKNIEAPGPHSQAIAAGQGGGPGLPPVG